MGELKPCSILLQAAGSPATSREGAGARTEDGARSPRPELRRAPALFRRPGGELGRGLLSLSGQGNLNLNSQTPALEGREPPCLSRFSVRLWGKPSQARKIPSPQSSARLALGAAEPRGGQRARTAGSAVGNALGFFTGSFSPRRILLHA